MKDFLSRGLGGLFGLTALVLATAPSLADDCSLKRITSLDISNPPNSELAVVPVQVNDTPRAFLVDTGSMYGAINIDVVGDLGLRMKWIAQNGIFLRGDRLQFGTSVDSFKIATSEATDFHTLVLPERSSQVGWDGLLALDLLSTFDLDFDFAGRKLNLFSPEHCPGKVLYWASNYSDFPFEMENGHITFDMMLDGKIVHAVLDTGSEVTWLYPSGQRALGVNASTAAVESVPDSQYKRYRFKSLTMAGLSVSNPLVYLEDPGIENAGKVRTDEVFSGYASVKLKLPDLVLGMDVLRQLHLYVSFKEKKIYVTSAEATK